MDEKVLKDSLIFKSLTKDEMEKAMENLYSREKTYEKGSTIFFAGKKTGSMGMVLEGSVNIESNNVWGDRSILTTVEKGGFFAQSYAILDDKRILVNVTARTSCKILFLRIENLKNINSTNDLWKQKVLMNLLLISAERNLALTKRSFHISPKTIRARVMSYLTDQVIKNGTHDFDIPFNRQQMADYLNVDRSALSKELGKMEKDGLISFNKNHFIIKKDL